MNATNGQKRVPKATRKCAICGKEFPCFPSSGAKTCGSPECHAEQWRLSRVGKPHKKKDALGKGHDLTGRTFGHLHVIRPVGRASRKVLWECKCLLCGNVTRVQSTHLTNGDTISCGCYRSSNPGLVAARGKALARFMQYDTHLGRISSSVIPKNNTSGVRGVYYNKKSCKWRATIGFQKRRYYLGEYDKLKDATEVRKIAEGKIFGEFLGWYHERHPDEKK